MPSWIRSSSVRSDPWYFFAIDTTSRRLALIMRSLAARSPRSIRLARSISSDGVSSRWRPISFRNSCSASVVALASCGVVERRLLVLAPAVVAQLDVVCVELLVEVPEVDVVELERLHELVDLGQAHTAELLPPIDERGQRSTERVPARQRHTE